MRKELTRLVAEKLERNQNMLQDAFGESVDQVGVRFCALDDFLPVEEAQRISKAFPPVASMRLLSSLKERKYTSKNFDQYDPILKEITFAIQDEQVIRIVEEITGIKDQQADPTLYAGGLSAMVKGDFLNPHLDNSHDMGRRKYRTLNLLYYTTPEWKLEYGGNLELWNKSVTNRVTIESRFNRLVLMETNPWSWHSVSPVQVNRIRTCVSNYYFSHSSPIGREYFNVTSFHGRPGERVKRVLLPLDNHLRNLARMIRPSGFGKKDIYQPNESAKDEAPM